MKILQLIHKPQNRGAETFACQLSHHLSNMGHEVKIVAVYSGTAQLPYSPEIESLGASAKKRVVDLPAWKKLSRIIKDYKPDIVQANSGDTLKYAVLSKLFFSWKSPIISRNASEVGRYLNSFFQKKLNRFLYRNVDLVISVSRASKKDIINHFPFLAENTQVIPIGLENKSNIGYAELKPMGVKHVIHVGGFSFEKNHNGLLNILETVLSQRKDVHLHLIGDGPLRPEIEHEVKKRGISQFVTFYGFISEPYPYIKSADVLVLPSNIEGLPGVLLEAMHCKTPVIAFAVGGIAELINPGTGALIEQGDESAFAQEILKTLTHKDKIRISNAYETVNKEFMNEQLALSFVNSYLKTLGR